MKYKKILLVITMITLLFTVTGCSQDNMDNINIIVTNYPNEYVLKELYSDHATISSIYPDGVDIDNYKIGKKQKNKYAKEALFVYNGLIEKERNLALDLLSINSELKIIDTAYVLETDYSPEELWLNPSSLLMMAQNVKIGLQEYVTSSVIKEDIEKNYETLKINLSELDSTYRLTIKNTENKKIKIVGIKYVKSAYGNSVVYLSDSLLKDYLYQINQSYSKLKVLFQNKYYDETTENFNIKTNDNVPVNNVYISADLEYSCPKEKCINQSLNIEASNLYYTENLSLNVSKVYNKNNMKKLLGLDFKENNGNIYINSEDYNKLFNKGNYQSSVFVKDVQDVRNTISSLEDAGFKTLYIKDTLVTGGYEQVTKIMGTVTKIVLIMTIFFISYFVINIILKSRNEYFGVIRMLGATKKVSKELLIIELLTVSNLAFFSFMIFIYLNSIHIINLEFINTILTYLNFKDYAILYIVLIMMSYLISQKFSKKLFKKSAISTIKEEV